MNLKKQSLLLSLILVLICFLFQGCAIELAMLEEGAAAGTLIDGAALSGAETELLIAEETKFFGEALPANTELTQLENVRAVFDGSEFPKLRVLRNGIETDFAEIVNKRELKLLDGKGTITLNENIYATSTDQVNLYSKSTNISKILKQISKNKLVLKIGEENGYFKVLVGRNKVMGFIKPNLLIPLLLATSASNQSYHVITCTHCQGYGYFTCSKCAGKGEFTCSSCLGKGEHICSSCLGKGEHTCSSCLGKGEHTCSSCLGKGEFTCSSCSGKGEHKCESCSGKGYTRNIFGGTTQCKSCGGKGYDICASCGGKGYGICASCGGKGYDMCASCGGKGYNMCASCGGKGYDMCASCGGKGFLSCGECFGYGNIQCIYCHGMGKLKVEIN